MTYGCSTCKRDLPVERYSRDRSHRRGYNYRCKDCEQERNKKYLIKHERGISMAEYERMFAEQNFGCAICKAGVGHTSPKGKPARLAVDHCHATGKIRGLLCCNCNRALGHLRDDVELLARAIEYLKAAT